jgi:hypothetical protein
MSEGLYPVAEYTMDEGGTNRCSNEIVENSREEDQEASITNPGQVQKSRE